MSRTTTLLRNITANWLGFAVNAGVTLVLTPFVLRQLGEARYGVWVISFSIIGYYGLFDFGFRGSINQHLTRYLAKADFRRASECMSTAVVTLGGFGAAFSVLSVAAAYAAPHVWNFPPGLEQEAFWCILIVGLTSAIQFVFFPYMAVFTATQRFDLANLIGITTRLLTAASVYLALSNGYGLVGISAATCSVSLLDYIVRWRVARRLVPQVSIQAGRATWTELRRLVSFGVWTFFISLNAYIYLHAQPLLIGALLPISAVGYYALATGLAQQINGAMTPIGQVLYPAAASMHAKGDSETLKRLYHDGTRLIMLVMVCVVTIAWFWAEDFYRLWIGPQYVVNGGVLPSVAVLLKVLLAATVSNYFSNVAAQILMGSGQVRHVAVLLICGSLLNLGLSLALIGRLGLLGLALATVSASLVIDLIAMPIALQRTVGLRVLPMIRCAVPRPLAVAVVAAIAFAALRSTGTPTNWPHLLLHGLLAGAISLVAILALGITRDERQRLVVKPLRRMRSRAAQPTL
jgi:O-antigen/teichoic acid export membrane protein